GSGKTVLAITGRPTDDEVRERRVRRSDPPERQRVWTRRRRDECQRTVDAVVEVDGALATTHHANEDGSGGGGERPPDFESDLSVLPKWKGLQPLPDRGDEPAKSRRIAPRIRTSEASAEVDDTHRNRSRSRNQRRVTQGDTPGRRIETERSDVKADAEPGCESPRGPQKPDRLVKCRAEA